LRQLQDKRLESPQIKFQRRIVFSFEPRASGIRHTLPPSAFSIQNYPAPKRIALRDAFWSSFSARQSWFVNFKPVMRI
jgi:hypothetical protein